MNTSIFEILRRPVVTEKSNYQASKLHQYVFEVVSSATRENVKTAVETAFDVNVVRVNIVNLPAKAGRSSKTRRLVVRKPGFKKAIVTLKEGQTIPIFEGVG
ncbi:MAG: 50S ribosomal protein L23 [Anaerolineaceae bacterium]|nr:50S ribosomal protein L23 [Anaerolineaceae bacterium]